MNSFRDKKSILVLDNAAVHLKYAIYLKCSIVGFKVLFLPQYSYD
jgi:transposase